MSSCCLSLALMTVLASPLEESAGVELRYVGALSKAGSATDGAAVKRFNLYCAVSREPQNGRRIVHVVNERGGGSWAWPERLGAITLDGQLRPISGGSIRLLFDYEGNPIVIPLPLPVAGFAGQLKSGAKWTEGKELWEVVKQAKVQNRDCWQLQVSTSFGRKRTLWIDIEAPIVVALEEKVFVGQGDEHSLTMQLETLQPLDEQQLARDTQALPALLKLKAALQRGENEFRPELNEAQLKLAGDSLPSLQKEAADTPLSGLVAAISKDINGQLQRTDEVARLAEKFVGKPAPAAALVLTDKTRVAEDAFKGQITVLHFWEYQNEPLVEPYGQVGYLDFLYGKRRKLGVQVYGIAVDGRLGDEQAASPALKSIQRLRQFMNLSYPIAVDDGKIIAKFGDPRKYGAKLPLWVVIDAEGKIAHYQAGFYKINPDEGLQQLDEVLVKLIREQKDKKE
ncbi:MAG TPA: redoxin domain-containing protein [Planctomycetaceae bacterium]|nr:redoxin domain-containing protein [Planctomycetaceae bacterium]